MHTKSRFAAMMLIGAYLGVTSLGIPTVPMRRGYTDEEKKKKCLLRDCQRLTDHNGGFCCAEHHKKHRALMAKFVNA